MEKEGKAIDTFNSGYNCTQSVLTPFAENQLHEKVCSKCVGGAVRILEEVMREEKVK